MAIKRPDIYEHNNSCLAISDSNFVRGGFRTPVANLTALYALSSNIDQLKERSSIVYVESEDNYYELIDINNVDNSNGWSLFMGTGLPISGATNGLNLDGRDISLGGTLVNTTVIESDGNDFCITSDSTCDYGLFDVSLSPNASISAFSVCTRDSGTTGSWWGLSGNCNNISFKHYQNATNGSGILICNNSVGVSTKISNVDRTVTLSICGLAYGADYASCYGNRSLVDKGYVDTNIACCSNIINVNNIGTTYTTLETDDYVGVSGSSCIYLIAAPKTGQRVIIADICGNALSAPITVDGNGNCINDGASSIINTNYGSITYIYNGNRWSAAAFIN
jgi:hypothetical protein